MLSTELTGMNKNTSSSKVGSFLWRMETDSVPEIWLMAGFLALMKSRARFCHAGQTRAII